MLGFWSMMVFLGVLTIGFIYEWKKERWNGIERRQRHAHCPRASRIIDPSTGKRSARTTAISASSTTSFPTRAFWSHRRKR